MKVLIIGTGGAGAIHAKELRRRGHAVWVHDIDREKAKQFSHQYAVHHTSSTDSQAYDFVVVATPAHVHRKIVEEQVDLGRTVVVEKPLALYPRDAWAIAQLPGEVYIAESQCYSEDDGLGVRRMAEIVQQGHFGEGPVLWHIAAQTTYRPQEWVEDLHVGGGAFVEGGVHMLTAAHVLFGMSCRWQGSVRHFNADKGGPDSGTILVDYNDGHGVSMNLYWGTEACFTGACKPLRGAGALIGSDITEAWWPRDNHQAMWGHLLKCIRGEAKPVARIEHASRAVQDVWKCYEAAGLHVEDSVWLPLPQVLTNR